MATLQGMCGEWGESLTNQTKSSRPLHSTLKSLDDDQDFEESTNKNDDVHIDISDIKNAIFHHKQLFAALCYQLFWR
ncbi:unnamed protein product [Gordionus sp. m RMFG-2023]